MDTALLKRFASRARDMLASCDMMPADTAAAWFNSLVALRFLEVNGLVPFFALSARRELVSNPWPFARWLPNGEAVIADVLARGETDSARYDALLRCVFQELSKSMPFPFGRAEPLATGLLDSGIIEMLCMEIPESAFRRPETLGWIYQYFSEARNISRNTPVEDVGGATRLFTPGWMAEYLVESSLGSLSARSGSPFRKHAPRAQRPMDPAGVTVLDPACGSGHLLLRAYDVLYEMYEDAGWTRAEIPRSILSANLFGLDIDPRAAELASLSLTLRAALDDSSILSDAAPPRPAIGDFRDQGADSRRAALLGSLWRPSGGDRKTAGVAGSILSKTYDCVIANPPYLANRLMPPELRYELKEGFPGAERDLFSAFVLRSLELCKPDGRISLMTPYVWLFISSYAQLRSRVLAATTITSLVQLEYSGFEDATVPVCCLALRKDGGVSGPGTFARLSDFRGPGRQEARAREAFADAECRWRHDVDQSRFYSLPSRALLYWLSDDWVDLIRRAPPLGEIAEGAVGLNTGDNKRFLRRWHEVAWGDIAFGTGSLVEALESRRRWLPYNKGGEYRKWSGNQEWVIDWAEDGSEIKTLAVQRNKGRHWSRYIQNLPFMLKPGITWSFVSSSHFGARCLPGGFMFDVAGSCVFPPERERLLVTAFLCSRAASVLMKAINPTLNFQVGNILALPYPREELEPHRSRLEHLATEAIALSAEEWDEKETSWGFRRSPLLFEICRTLEGALDSHVRRCEARREKLRDVEAEVDLLVFRACGIAEAPGEPELTIRVPQRKVLAHELLSYVIGCRFGRYSLERDGIVIAGPSEPASLPRAACDDNLLPVSPHETPSIFVEPLLREMFPEDRDPTGTLCQELGATLDRYLALDFYERHVRDYSGRPIYLLFASGRLRVFQALSYTHRLSKATLEAIRDRYLPKAFASERSNVSTRRSEARLRELEEFSGRLEAAIAEWRDIDLSLGVVENHHRLRGLLAPIRRSVMRRA